MIVCGILGCTCVGKMLILLAFTKISFDVHFMDMGLNDHVNIIYFTSEVLLQLIFYKHCMYLVTLNCITEMLVSFDKKS